MNDLPDTLARLEARVETLEQRVYALEHQAGAPSEITVQEESPQQAALSEEGILPYFLGRGVLGARQSYARHCRCLPDASGRGIELTAEDGGGCGGNRVRAGMAGVGIAHESRRLAGRHDVCVHIGADPGTRCFGNLHFDSMCCLQPFRLRWCAVLFWWLQRWHGSAILRRCCG